MSIGNERKNLSDDVIVFLLFFWWVETKLYMILLFILHPRNSIERVSNWGKKNAYLQKTCSKFMCILCKNEKLVLIQLGSKLSLTLSRYSPRQKSNNSLELLTFYVTFYTILGHHCRTIETTKKDIPWLWSHEKEPALKTSGLGNSDDLHSL